MSHAVAARDRVQKLFKKGLKYCRDGHIELAEACCHKILKIDPTSPEARQLLRLLEETPAGAQAASLGAALTGGPDTLHHRSASYLAEGNTPGATERLRRDAGLRPESWEARQKLAQALERSGDLQAAAESYRRAAALKPDSPELLCHLARVLFKSGAFPEAAEMYRQALVLNPTSHEIYNDLGLVLTSLNNFAAALEAFRRSLRLNPRCAKTIASLGYLFERKGDLQSAADAYRDVIKLDPSMLPAYADLGFVLYGLGEVAEAEQCFRRLRELQPDSAEATANLGLIHLLQGDFAGGWPEYEARWKAGVGDDRKLLGRRWKGEPLGGERILIYAEQGFGDTLQFTRYVPLVAARGGEVVLEVQPALRRLLSGIEGASRIISRGEPLPEFTWQCPLLSLPMAFGTEFSTIPAKVPYLHPESARVEAWRRRLRAESRRIGLAWAGNPNDDRDRLRSVPLEQLMPLIDTAGAVFYSLQVGPGSGQVKQMPPGARLIDLTADLNDFADTAALVANLDLVISVDTAVAHLAGAMGRRVWIMLSKGCDWRWLLEREDSPWYPTARLFRQASAGNWKEVVDRVGAELRRGLKPS